MSDERFPFGWRYDGARDTYVHYSGFELTAHEIDRMRDETDKRRAEWLQAERHREAVAVQNFRRLSQMYFGV